VGRRLHLTQAASSYPDHFSNIRQNRINRHVAMGGTWHLGINCDKMNLRKVRRCPKSLKNLFGHLPYCGVFVPFQRNGRKYKGWPGSNRLPGQPGTKRVDQDCPGPHQRLRRRSMPVLRFLYFDTKRNLHEMPYLRRNNRMLIKKGDQSSGKENSRICYKIILGLHLPAFSWTLL